MLPKHILQNKYALLFFRKRKISNLKVRQIFCHSDIVFQTLFAQILVQKYKRLPCGANPGREKRDIILKQNTVKLWKKKGGKIIGYGNWKVCF
jgi:hypothetical protein